MRVNRKHIVFKKPEIHPNENYVGIPAHECLSFVWELTQEIYGLTGEHDVESRLQRDVVNIIRQQS